MWAFFSRRLRMWLILAVAVPVGGWLLGRVAEFLERRRGPNAVSSTLRRGRAWLQGRARGPLGKRLGETDQPAR
jgi:hypothetical protein